MVLQAWVVVETLLPPDLPKWFGSDLERRGSVHDSSLIDRFGRRITNLRVSVTDQCNFRCLYCLPPEGLPTLDSAAYLTPGEIARFAKVASALGIDKIRLTGGEPLLRKEIAEIVEKLSEIEKIKCVALTTNGTHLGRLARALKKAGLGRINMSLDTLDANTFKRIALHSDFNAVMDGLLTALAEGFPVKLNAVIMRGINDHEIEGFIRFAMQNQLAEIRFIEFMPLCGTGWRPELVFPFTGMVERLKKNWQVETLADHGPGEVATRYCVSDGARKTTLGLITTLTRPFCNTCSRIRLSADGVIRPCLFSHLGIPLSDALKNKNVSDVEIARRLMAAVDLKPKGNEFNEAHEKGRMLSDVIAAGRSREANPSIRHIGG